MNMTTIPEAGSLVSLVLESQPSCLEFATSRNILVIGTYNLEPGQSTTRADSDEHDEAGNASAQKRSGSLLVFNITEQAATILQSKTLPYAVLDLHLSSNDPSVFAIATSVGSICFFTCDFKYNGDLNFMKCVQICEPSILVLSLAYQESNSTKESPRIAVSLSNGNVAIFSEEMNEPEIITASAHSQEAWTIAWSALVGETGTEHAGLYSGGDDSVLYGHDITSLYLHSKNETSDYQYQPASREGRTHAAGVTAIIPLAYLHEGCEVLMTGSYDENFRIIHMPEHGCVRAKVLAEKHLGGGVWRLSRPFSASKEASKEDISFKVLASCMHAGVRVLEVRRDAGSWTIEVLTKFTEHESMNYASDVLSTEKGFLFVSTSFYDRKLCIWKMRDDEDLSENG